MLRAFGEQIDRCRVAGTRAFAVIAMVALAGCPGPPSTGAGSIEVTVRDPRTGAPISSAPVTLLGTTIGAFTSASGVALLSNVATGVRTVRVQLAGFCTNDRAVQVVDAAVATVVIWNCGDGVELHNALTDPAIALVDLRAEIGGSEQCVPDELLIGTGRLNIPLNALSLQSCPGAVSVLTRDHALFFSRNAGTLPWTDGFGDVMSIELAPSRLVVPIRFMVLPDSFGSYLDGDVLANDQLTMAESILSTELTGVQLAGSESGAAIEINHTSEAATKVVGNGCKNVDNIRADPALYAPGRLNIFVVEQALDGFGTLTGGTTCSVEQAPDIIFLSPSAAKSYTLAHEIGHAFGLSWPSWGHTDGLGGFWYVSDGLPLNLMDTGRTVDGMYLSVGQVVRMILSEDSWLNRPSAPDGSTLRQRQSVGAILPVAFPCGCPETASTDDCTSLNRDRVRSGNLHVPTTDTLACGVDTVPEKFIACGSDLNVDVRIELLPWHAVGGALFFSLTPAIVQVNTAIDDTKHWILMPIANGAGRIRVYADGSPYDFPVTVSECP